jgi:hypothetical protein
MATPGSVKLNKPDILRLSENRVKVAVSQNNNIAVSDRLLTSTTVWFASRRFAASFSIGAVSDFTLYFPEGEVFNSRGITSFSVVLRLVLVESKELNSGEARDSVGASKFLVGCHIDGSDIYDAFEIFGGLGPFRSQVFAVTTPGGIKLNHP